MLPRVVTLDGLRIPVDSGGISRQARLTIQADGGLHLTAAADVALEEIVLFLESKRKWIYTKLAEKEELTRAVVSRELVNGETFQYLGRNFRLQIVEEGLERVRLINGRLQMPAQLTHAGKTPIIDWYRTSGHTWVSPRVKEWAERLRVEPGQLDVADLGRKWGSSTAGGQIRLHWAVFQLPTVLIDYVVVHELAHLHEPHHGPAFWAELGRAMPDYVERKSHLARSGSSLWFGQLST